MTCEECGDLLPLYVTGDLDAAEAGNVRRHLAQGCPRCAGELAALDTAFNDVAGALPPMPTPDRAWDKIQERIALKQQLEAPASTPRKLLPATRPLWPRWVVAAAMIVMLGAMIVILQSNIRAQALVNAGSLREKNLQSQFADLQAKIDSRDGQLQHQLAELRSQNKLMQTAIDTGERQMMNHLSDLVTATPYAMAAGAQAPTAKLFWNKSDGTWMLVAAGLKPLAPGMTYELWIINAKGDKIAAGTFAPDASGRALHTVKLPPDVGTITTAAVTDEPAPGRPSPTGAIQFAGKL